MAGFTEQDLLGSSGKYGSFSCVYNEKFAVRTDKGRESKCYTRNGDLWFECSPNALPRVLINKINAKQYRSFIVMGNVSLIPPVIKDIEQQEGTTKVDNNNVADLLAQCASTIEDLSKNLDECQVLGKPLSYYAGSTYRGLKARAQLIEKGLVEKCDNGVRLTPLGQQHAIGKHSRNPDTKQQTILYTDNVIKFINGVQKNNNRGVGTPPFKIISPDNKEYTVDNVRAFAKEYDLIPAKVYLLANGCSDSHMGWRLAVN